jgi:2-ketoarginine methyltransferase
LIANLNPGGPVREVELPEATLAAHLQPIRGLALAHAILASFELGLFESLQAHWWQTDELAVSLGLHAGRLNGLLDYLENEDLVERSNGQVSLTERGRELQLARPWYELMVGGYSGTFAQLSTTLKTGAPYADRDGRYVAAGSCGISQHDALPMVLELLRLVEHPKALVDLGCGDGTFVAQVAATLPDVPAFGVEPHEAARKEAELQAARLGVSNLRILGGDALNPPEQLGNLTGGVCYITAFVLQEMLEQSGEAAVVQLLRETFESDPNAAWIVIEVDRRHPLPDESSDLALAYYNAYYLIHQVTQQRLIPIDEWRRIYAQAGLMVVAEVFPEPEYDPLRLKFGHLLRLRDSA